MSNRFKRTLAIALCSSAMGFTLTPVAQAAPAAADNRCTPIRFVYVKGTFSSKSDDSTHPDRMHEGKDLYNAMARAVGPQNVSGYSVSYPASVGAISPFLVAGMNINGWGGGNEAVTFGDSVRTAVKNGTGHISDYKRSCPNTKFVIGGYSQGASAAGTIASEIAAGKVAGVTSDDVAGVLLYADPYRAAMSDFDSYSGKPESTLYANPMKGVMGRNLETIVGYAPNGRKDFVGWAGPRAQNFAGMQGKVMSLCHDLDPACSVPANGMLRMVADYVDKNNSYPIIKDVKTFQKLQKFVQQAIQSGAVDKVMRGDASAGDDVAKAFFAAGFTPDDLLALIFATKEVAELTTKMYKDAGVEHVATYEEFLIMLFITALPSIVQSGTSHDAIIGLLKNPALTAALASLGPEAVAVQEAAVATMEALKLYDIAMTKINELSSKAGLPQLPAMSSRLALEGSSIGASLLPTIRVGGSSLVTDGSSIGSSQDLSSGGSSINDIGSWGSSIIGSSNGAGSSNMGIEIGGSSNLGIDFAGWSAGNVDRDDMVTLSSNYQENIDKAKARAEKGDYVTAAEILGINLGSIVNDITKLTAQSLGLLKKMRGPEFQSVLDEARIIGQFGYHASYWDGRFKANGTSGGEAAQAWVSEIASNVVAGKSWKYKPSGKATNNVEPDIEKSIEPYSVRYLKENPALTRAEYNATQPGYVFIVDRVRTGTRGLIFKRPVYVNAIVAAYPKDDPNYEKYIKKATKDPVGNFGVYNASGSWRATNFKWGETPIGIDPQYGKFYFGKTSYPGHESSKFKQTNNYYEKRKAVKAYNEYISGLKGLESTAFPNSNEDFYSDKDNLVYKQKNEVSKRAFSELKLPDFSSVKVDVPASSEQPAPKPKPSTEAPKPTPKPSTEAPKPTTEKEKPTPKPEPSTQAPTAKPNPSAEKKKPGTTTQNPGTSAPEPKPKPSTQASAPSKEVPVKIGDFPQRDKTNSVPVVSEKNPNQVAVNIPSTSKDTTITLDSVLNDGETVKGVKHVTDGWAVEKNNGNTYTVKAPKDNTPGTVSFTVNGPKGEREIKAELLTPKFNIDELKWTVSGKKDNATLVKGPGSFNGRFKYSKYADPVIKNPIKPASAETKYADGIDKITVDPETGDIVVPDSVPNGTYVVPVQVTDTETGKDAVINVTVIKDVSGVRVEQNDMVSAAEANKPEAPGKETAPAPENKEPEANQDTPVTQENPAPNTSGNTPVEPSQTATKTGEVKPKQPGVPNPEAPNAQPESPAENTGNTQPETSEVPAPEVPQDSEANSPAAGTPQDDAASTHVESPDTAEVNEAVPPATVGGSKTQPSGAQSAPVEAHDTTSQGDSATAGEQTSSTVRKVLASTGASVTLLAILSILIAGMGVAVATRRKDND